MQPAARVGDDVKHEAWETAQAAPIGLAGGIVITIAIIATGGTAAVAFGIGGAVAAIGGLIDTVFVSGDCKITTGADTVFTNLKAAAFAHSKCKTSDGHQIVRGAEHVFIEDSRASRVDDYSDCQGHIVSGSPPPNEVRIGGPMKPRETPIWYLIYQGVDFGFSAASLASGWKELGTLGKWYESGSLLLNGYSKATGEDLEYPGSTAKNYYDTGNSLKGGFDSLREFLK